MTDFQMGIPAAVNGSACDDYRGAFDSSTLAKSVECTGHIHSHCVFKFCVSPKSIHLTLSELKEEENSHREHVLQETIGKGQESRFFLDMWLLVGCNWKEECVGLSLYIRTEKSVVYIQIIRKGMEAVMDFNTLES
ncbi:hypothetical protein STEG23_001974 [Scotinomys teguina]